MEFLKKNLNVLVLDDNPIVVDSIQKRIAKLDEYFVDATSTSLTVFNVKVPVYNSKDAGKIVEDFLILNSIDFLLLDRGFFNLVDPVNVPNEGLHPDYLYVPIEKDRLIITEILAEISFKQVRRLKGIIVYTFDEPYQTSEWYVEPAQIKKQIAGFVGNRVNADDILVVLTNTGLYDLAGINIYDRAGEKFNENFIYQGRKSDFALYGLFVGEMLYHRIHWLLERQRKRLSGKKQIQSLRKLVLLYVVLTALSIGGNAAYSWIFQQLPDNRYLFFISILLALILPLFVLLLKPEWLIDLDEEL